MNFLRDKKFLVFSAKFLLVFLLAYYGTVAVIGITSPGKLFSPFIEKYLNYPNWLRYSLLYGSKHLLALFGIDTYTTTDFRLRVPGGRGVFLSYSCIGYGVMSFWIAFVIASAGKFRRKALWWIGGLWIIWLINITRISLLLVAINRNWNSPFGMDHHLLFNIAAYIAIFIVIYFFEKPPGKMKAKAASNASVK